MNRWDRRTGQIFYLDYLTGTTKGSIRAGTTLIGAKTGAQGLVNYSSDQINDEQIGTGNGTNRTFTGTLSYKPVIPGTLVITDGVETFTDNGNGVLVTDASGGTNGTINYTTGQYSVTFKTAPGNQVHILADYRFNQERDTSGIGEVDIQLSTAVVTARTRKLRAKWLHLSGSSVLLN